MIKNLAILHSPSAGNNNISRDEIRQTFEEHGKELLVLEMNAGVEGAIKQIQRSKSELIVAAGGDGTVNMAANIAVHADLPLAILPLGTYNHFAKDIGLPLNLEAAVDVILDGHFEKLDYCTVNDHVFVNNSSIGMYPISVRERGKLEPMLGKWLATVVSFAGAIRRLKTMRLKLELGQKQYIYKTPLVFVGNNSYEFKKRGFLNRTNLKQGRLFIYVIRANSVTTFIRLVIDAFFGKRQKSKDFITTTKKVLTISSRKKMVDVAIDGEVKKLQSPLTYFIHPRKLTVCKQVGRE